MISKNIMEFVKLAHKRLCALEASVNRRAQPPHDLTLEGLTDLSNETKALIGLLQKEYDKQEQIRD